MPKQRMAGYTPFQGAAYPDDAAPRPALSAPPEQIEEAPAAESVSVAPVGPSVAEPVREPAAESATSSDAAVAAPVAAESRAEQPAVSEADAATVAPAAAATTSTGPAAGETRDAMPYEQRQRMAGYTPLRGDAPTVTTSAAPAADAAPSTAAPAAVESATAPGAAQPGVAESAAVPAAASTPAAAPAQQAPAPAAPTGTAAAVTSAAVGVPYEQRQRMKGYVPFSGPVAAATPAAAAGAPVTSQHAEATATDGAAETTAAETTAVVATPAAAQDTAASGAGQDTAAPAAAPLAGAPTTPAPVAAAPGAAGADDATRAAQEAAAAAQEAAAAARAAAQEAQAAVAALREAQAAGQGATAPARAASPTGTATTSSGTKASGADADAEKTPMSRTRKLIFWVVGAVVVAVALVLAARGLRTLEPVQEFIAAYDGNPSRPGEDPTGGYPWWMRWQHFLNMFLMVLIIRTGLQIRHEQRPPANFTPNAKGLFTAPGNTPKKFSLTMWMHQALDILWVVNGAIFVVLLFATGLWSRTIPTDPFVFHHALSAGIQYLSLDWPTGDKWVYYNALQMIAYTLVIFVAAPIAALTGWRMSSWWPTEAKGLNKAFPMEVARKVHFPTMIFFVIFIAIHLFLVAFTGVMKNLNYMYTGRDATDAWGLVVFLVSVAVTVAAWFLLRPAFVSPVASKFGTVGR